MSYNIVLTTAEDIVAVVDAVIAKGTEAEKEFIAEFTGIATDDQVIKALQMACELQLIVFDSSRGCYGTPSFLAKKLVSASSDEQKAVFMRLILEQYAPYTTFKTRYAFTKSIDLACRQTKTLHAMTSNERDVKNTLISIPLIRSNCPNNRVAALRPPCPRAGNRRKRRLISKYPTPHTPTSGKTAQDIFPSRW